LAVSRDTFFRRLLETFGKLESKCG